MRYNIKSIIAFTFVAIAYQSNATPILSIDKTDMVRLEKRVIIPAPSPITFSSMGRASTPSKAVASTATTTNTAVGTNETGFRTVVKTTNAKGGEGQERVIKPATSTSFTTTKTMIGKSGSGTMTRSTLNLPTNSELNNQYL